MEKLMNILFNVKLDFTILQVLRGKKPTKTNSEFFIFYFFPHLF